MKIACFENGSGPRLGAAATDGGLIDLAMALQRSGDEAGSAVLSSDLISLIEAGPEATMRVRRALDWAITNGGCEVDMGSITWLPPVLRPSKICCLALNNSANSERIIRGPSHPALFLKAANALLGHGGKVKVRAQYGRVHPEPELGIVIAKKATSIDAAAAYDYVYGYTIHNDITSPSMRAEDTFQYRAIHPSASGGAEIEYVDTFTSYPGRYKCSDTFSPLGPWVVTRDEISDPHDLTVTLKCGEQVVTADSTANLTNKVPETLAFITQYITLLPGDVVSMGTALKRAGGSTPAVQNIDLQHIDEPISITIDRIGTLMIGVQRL
jgi:2-keto-4-pentenoate hydratase/2-oxohepta-3-ene-1,7-dioic acid hydratase in catechol pathway